MNSETQSLGTFGFRSATMLVPSIQKGLTTQTHYVYLPNRPPFSLAFSLKGSERVCDPEMAACRELSGLGRDDFPYGFSETGWWEYCLSPHSYLKLRGDEYQVGLNLFNRFLHIDLESRRAELVDPKVDNELLSTTNWYDPDREEVWFASWPVEDTVRRIADPEAEARVSIWKYAIPAERSEQVWNGGMGDALHQLALSPDRRYIILTELGLRFWGPFPDASPERNPEAWRKLRKQGVVPSKTLVLDRSTGREWRLSIPTAGHVEFDPTDPEIFYLSSHNIGLFGPKVGIFGEGVIQKYRLRPSGPELLAEFTHPRFHRITTHIVFRHRDRVLIGVTGYPGTVFLIDGDSMTLYQTLDLNGEEKDQVNIADSPHLCREDSYGIAASDDGEHLMVSGSGFLRVADIAKGRFAYESVIDEYKENSCFTGHMGISFGKG